jgi:putative ABC transport system permease protein
MNLLKWVLLSNVLAWPAAYLFMSRWLRNFPNKIDLGLWIFSMSNGILVVIGLITGSRQTLRAPKANPIDSLRHE